MLGPLLTVLQYVIYTSVFVDDVMLSYHGANGPESSKMLCIEDIRHVAISVGRHITTVFGRVHQNVALGQSLLSTIDLY